MRQVENLSYVVGRVRDDQVDGCLIGHRPQRSVLHDRLKTCPTLSEEFGTTKWMAASLDIVLNEASYMTG